MSNADVIYSHLKADDIQQVKVNKIDMFFRYMANKGQTTIDKIEQQDILNKQMLFEAHLLKPYFERFIKTKEEIYGNINTWTEDMWKNVEEEFMNKYMSNKRTYSY